MMRNLGAQLIVASCLLGCGEGSGAGSGGGEGGASSTSASTSGSGGAGETSSSASSGSSSGQGGADGAHAGLVPMFVAQGHVGRTTISCDGGKTWVANRSDDDAARCFENGFDCDHTPGAANGVTWGDGWFYATFGWGQPGSVRRSHDGVTWDKVVNDTTFGGMAFGNGKVLAGSRKPRLSADAGATWTELAEVPLDIWNVREVAFAPFDTGRFVLVGNDGETRRIAISSDDGQSWKLPTVPADCDVSFYRAGGIAYGNGVLLVTDGGVHVCRSVDGGATWKTGDLGGAIESQLLWTGKEFMGWGGGSVRRSADGVSWTSQPISPNLNIGPTAVSDDGAFVAVRGGWSTWYDAQKLYRSDDGVTWQELSAGSFVGSHPITAMTFGWALPSAACGGS
jgi:hypothetical protein